MFCRDCLQGYHIGECLPDDLTNENTKQNQYTIDPNVYILYHIYLIFLSYFVNNQIKLQKATDARWDDASRITIKIITKPCPKCRTPTERSGGCMHMVCARSNCTFEWCWVCQTEWTRDCMGAHWFG